MPNNNGSDDPTVKDKFNSVAEKKLNEKPETSLTKKPDDLEKRPFNPKDLVPEYTPTGTVINGGFSSPPVDEKKIALEAWRKRMKEQKESETLSEKFNRKKHTDRAKTPFNRAGKSKSSGGRNI